jgi:hypothetical protein
MACWLAVLASLVLAVANTDAQTTCTSGCTIWPGSAGPAIAADPDNTAVELGVKFRSDVNGTITGIRFYKASTNTGTHTGRLWTAAGALLGTVTFSSETASGWQQATFATPVAITANTVYVASYHTAVGRYSVTEPFFASAGVDRPPLHALANGVAGGNGVYRYGAAGSFPNSTFNSSNYWVDVVFNASGGSTPPTVASTTPAGGATAVAIGTAVTATFSQPMDGSTIGATTFGLQGPAGTVAAAVIYNEATQTATLTPGEPLGTSTTYTATILGGGSGVKSATGTAMTASVSWSFTTAAAATPPTVVSVTPLSGATEVATTTIVTATFSEAMDPASINGNTFRLQGPAGAVAAAVSYNAAALTATLTPATALANSARYTATIVGGAAGVKDSAGTPMEADLAWSFTAVAAASAGCPCTIWPGSATPAIATEADPSGVEVGVRFQSDVAGVITGLRFYKGAGNTGPHVGNLWSASGTLLASVPFAGETAAGWQQANFSSPVPIVANTVYVASYHTSTGYAVTAPFFASAGVDTPPLHALAGAGNGVYTYGATSVFPTSTFNSSNYWVDVVFNTSGGSLPPPTVASVAPVSGATGVATSTTLTATFSRGMDATSITPSTFSLQGPSGPVAGGVTYNAGSMTATFTPGGPLTGTATHTATVRGGASGVKDISGLAMAADFTWSFTTAGGACAPPANPIECENSLPGALPSQWDIAGAGDPSIQGFATDISVNRGQRIGFKIDTDARAYRLDIYRMGFYAGRGARLVATIQPSAALPQTQPNCLTQGSTGLIDCGNWAESAAWDVPATATSGIYFAKLVRQDTGGASHIVFVIRDDTSTSAILFQTSDTTWQAYNEYDGNSLYVGSPAGRAYKVSYNRPFITRDGSTAHDWVFNAEYPMVRWLEANGYDVTYFTGVDSDRRGALIRQHKVFMSVGHDEYWSGGQRANVEAARDAGVHLAFFSGNEVFWKTRWENSIDGSGTPYRTLVCYKETHANAKIDPTPVWTGSWRDPRFSPPSDGGRPENALTGTIFMVNDIGCCSMAITVPAAQGTMRFWRNTSIAALAPGATATLPAGTLGYEWDEDLDNGSRPPGLINLSSTTRSISGNLLQDYGSTYGSGSATHRLTLYRAPSRALVFGAGTVQWSWGLDGNHDVASSTPDLRMQQATVNLLADMGVQPRTLQAGLTTASQSTDTAAPTSVITSPAPGATLTVGVPVTITGSASDAGGGVLGVVEVSVDGGRTWRRADGLANWSLTWTPTVAGTVTIGSSATDDSANIEIPTAGVPVAVALPGGGGGGGSGTGVLLGQQELETQRDSVAAGEAEAFPLTASATGTVGSLTIYLDGTSTTARLTAGLYADANGHPRTLLAQGSRTSPTPGAWNTITIPGVAVTAGTRYWIAIMGTQGGTIVFRDDPAGTCTSETSAQKSLTSLPSTWATGTTYGGSCPLSAYGSQ